MIGFLKELRDSATKTACKSKPTGAAGTAGAASEVAKGTHGTNTKCTDGMHLHVPSMQAKRSDGCPELG
eukprot:9185525-Alexandrium_andersonii.AAC.1